MRVIDKKGKQIINDIETRFEELKMSEQLLSAPIIFLVITNGIKGPQLLPTLLTTITQVGNLDVD